MTPELWMVINEFLAFFFFFNISHQIAGAFCRTGRTVNTWMYLGKITDHEKLHRLHDNLPLAVLGGSETEYNFLQLHQKKILQCTKKLRYEKELQHWCWNVSNIYTKYCKLMLWKLRVPCTKITFVYIRACICRHYHISLSLKISSLMYADNILQFCIAPLAGLFFNGIGITRMLRSHDNHYGQAADVIKTNQYGLMIMLIYLAPWWTLTGMDQNLCNRRFIHKYLCLRTVNNYPTVKNTSNGICQSKKYISNEFTVPLLLLLLLELRKFRKKQITCHSCIHLFFPS